MECKKPKLPYGSIVVCRNCGKEFIRDEKHKGFKYCSFECQQDFSSKMSKALYENKKKKNPPKIAKCIICGKEFKTDPQHNSTAKYCSKECRARGQRKTNTESEEEVENLVRYLITKMNRASSLDAYTPIYHTESLNPTDAQKTMISRRDKNKCRICNSRSSLEIHHIVKRRDGGNNDLDNLITLCSKCHRHIETGNVETAIKKCTQNYIRVANNDSSIFAFHLNNFEKVEYAKEELNKLYNIIVNSGDSVNTESIKICIDDILEHIE